MPAVITDVYNRAVASRASLLHRSLPAGRSTLAPHRMLLKDSSAFPPGIVSLVLSVSESDHSAIGNFQ